MGRPNQNSKWKAGQQPDPVFVTDTTPKKTTPTPTAKSVSEVVESPTINDLPFPHISTIESPEMEAKS